MKRLSIILVVGVSALCLNACDRGQTREEAPGRRSADPSANVGGALTGPKPTPQVATPARKPLLQAEQQLAAVRSQRYAAAIDQALGGGIAATAPTPIASH